MHFILQGVWEAIRLLFSGDSTTYEIALRSLEISAAALAVSLVIGVPMGTAIALTQFPGRRFVVAVVNTGMGVPPVVVGLIVALFLWRTGPLGDLHLMYTLQAMIIAQIFIALPIVAGLSLAALQQLDPGFRLQILALGAGRARAFLLLMREIRVPLHYTGLTGKAQVAVDGGVPQSVTLDPSEIATLKLTLPAQGRAFALFTE